MLIRFVVLSQAIPQPRFWLFALPWNSIVWASLHSVSFLKIFQIQRCVFSRRSWFRSKKLFILKCHPIFMSSVLPTFHFGSNFWFDRRGFSKLAYAQRMHGKSRLELRISSCMIEGWAFFTKPVFLIARKQNPSAHSKTMIQTVADSVGMLPGYFGEVT